MADPRTMCEAFWRTRERRGDAVALRTLGATTRISWNEYARLAEETASGFHALGARRGDRIAFMLTNRPEFNVADTAAMLLGATCFSIYNTSSAEQIEYLLTDAGARIVLAEPQFAEVLAASGVSLDYLILTEDTFPGSRGEALSFDRLREIGRTHPVDVRALSAEVEPDDELCLIYTSGTTGPPKGVRLTHGNLIAETGAFYAVAPLPDGARTVSFLPSAHIGDRFMTYYSSIALGFEVTTCPDMTELPAYLLDSRPHWISTVPRIWEKVQVAMLEWAHDRIGADETEAAVALSIERDRRLRAGERVDDDVQRRWESLDETIFAPMREAVGLDEIELACIGGVSCTIDLLESYRAVGIELLELWGMSETAAVATLNPRGRAVLGSAGRALPGVELRFAEDGEILVRGPIVTPGYWNRPDQTREVLDADGWLRTGDVGRMDGEGYLFIVDRKKEIMINAAGKNMSPANIEAVIRASSPAIGHACAIGERRRYNTALLVLDLEGAAQFTTNGSTVLDCLVNDERVLDEIARAVGSANSRLSRVEQIKRWTVLPVQWPAAGDELTPTMKLKRRSIAEKYASEIDAMYG